VSERPRVLTELGVELERAARATLPPDLPTGARASRVRRWSRWRPAGVVVLALLGGAAAAFASGLFSFGAPAQPTPIFSNPRAGFGSLTPGTVRLLAISTADPNGGPVWGMRVLSTTRGVGCIQVGRLVDGKLVALGQDGAFNDDGRAHALTVSAEVDPDSCTPLDGKGHIFNSVTLTNEPASAAWWFGGTNCIAPGTPRRSSARAQRACPPGDERDLYYGLLGPDAKSITYTLDGKTHTQATVGPEGAYLIVTNAPRHQFHLPGSGGDVADDVPVASPIISIQYRNGANCHLITARKWIVGFHACAPTLSEPVGYVPVAAPTHAQIATPIKARAVRAHGGWEIVVSFKSRIPVESVRGVYQLQWHTPKDAPNVNGYTPMDVARRPSSIDDVGAGLGADASNEQDISAGQTVTAMIGQVPLMFPAEERAKLPPGVLVTPGITRGTVTLRYSTGPSLDGAQPTTKITVGKFAVRVP
jgi:hypothetical protein